jgi:hypothetical protein
LWVNSPTVDHHINALKLVHFLFGALFSKQTRTAYFRRHTSLPSKSYLCFMFAFADFKHTWVKTCTRAAGRLLAFLKSFSDLEHDLDENLAAHSEIMGSNP